MHVEAFRFHTKNSSYFFNFPFDLLFNLFTCDIFVSFTNNNQKKNSNIMQHMLQHCKKKRQNSNKTENIKWHINSQTKKLSSKHWEKKPKLCQGYTYNPTDFNLPTRAWTSNNNKSNSSTMATIQTTYIIIKMHCWNLLNVKECWWSLCVCVCVREHV